MTINRSTFKSIIPVADQPKVNKVIKVGTTPTGYTRIVTVRTQLVAGKPVEIFTDVMIHPDKAIGLDVQQFDSVSFDNTKGRDVVEPRPNTTYMWATGCKAVGRHLVTLVPTDEIDAATGQPVCERILAGVGVYGEPAKSEPQSDTNGN